MKEMFAKDSDRLIVLDDNVKHKNLFGSILLKVICWILLMALTVYGIFFTLDLVGRGIIN